MSKSIIKLLRGLKVNLPTLNRGEPAYVSDESELYIGTGVGNVKITHKKERSRRDTNTNKRN